MRRQVLKVGRIELVLGLCLLAAIWLAGPSLEPSAQAQPPSQPRTPHGLEGRADCLLCHSAAGPRPAPADHAGRPKEGCLACHPLAAVSPLASPPPQPAPPTPAPAGEPPKAVPTQAVPTPGPPVAAADNATCFTCHQNPALSIVFPSGEKLAVSADPGALAASVHAKLQCVSCHSDKSSYPHPKVEAASLRAYRVAAARACQGCHQQSSEKEAAGAHGQGLAAGNLKTATCTDCHLAHSVQRPTRVAITVGACARCHPQVTASYWASVHGKRVLAGRRDAATCADCHSPTGQIHAIQPLAAPESVGSPNKIPETCGRCHTKSLETYLATFHGRAMRLGVRGNAATCTDCHGAYGVQPVHAPEASLTPAKLAEACAKCHPGADENFASGWMGHEEASPRWFPLVYFTERFLFYLTTTVVAFGILHVELDLLRWLVNRWKKGR